MITKLIEALQQALDHVEQPHYECELKNLDAGCRAEQYGDGNKDEHAFILNTRQLLRAAQQMKSSDIAAALVDAMALSRASKQPHYVVRNVRDGSADNPRYQIERDETLLVEHVVEASVYAFDAEPWKRNRKV